MSTLHKQVSSFEARKVGAALIARNIATLIEDTLDQPGGWRIALLLEWWSRSQSLRKSLVVLDGGSTCCREDTRPSGNRLERIDEQIENNQLMIVQGPQGAGRPGRSKAVCLMVSHFRIGPANHRVRIRAPTSSSPAKEP